MQLDPFQRSSRNTPYSNVASTSSHTISPKWLHIHCNRVSMYNRDRRSYIILVPHVGIMVDSHSLAIVLSTSPIVSQLAFALHSATLSSRKIENYLSLSNSTRRSCFRPMRVHSSALAYLAMSITIDVRVKTVMSQSSYGFFSLSNVNRLGSTKI